MKAIVIVVMSGLLGYAQQAEPRVWAISPDERITLTPEDALVGATDQVFPHIATGGSWSTIITIVNISTQTVNFTNHFYAEDGSPMTVSFYNYPQAVLTTTTAAAGSLPPGTSFNFLLFSSSPNLQVGWASLEYVGTGRIGGYAIFRQSVTGRATFEALTPLSAYDDYKFFMSFDNIEGFITAMALVNPASNSSNNVTITATDLSGHAVASTTVTLPPHGHMSFAVSDLMPALANQLGTLYVQSDINRLSGMGLRFNGLGGFAFTSIPIMNWIGMFP